MNIILTYHNLPNTIGALTHSNEDGSYTILINARLSLEMQQAAVLHELSHIQNNHFSSTNAEADLIEKMLHKNPVQHINLSDFVFFSA